MSVWGAEIECSSYKVWISGSNHEREYDWPVWVMWHMASIVIGCPIGMIYRRWKDSYLKENGCWYQNKREEMLGRWNDKALLSHKLEGNWYLLCWIHCLTWIVPMTTTSWAKGYIINENHFAQSRCSLFMLQVDKLRSGDRKCLDCNLQPVLNQEHTESQPGPLSFCLC